ncbi:MAG: aminopeptidase N [Gammaproteobacteria bacterium]|nr:aminopeptidase N [Gammaproteobacteria bacterium]
MREGEPQTIRLADYRPPAFLIDSVDLHFDVAEGETRVTAQLAVRRNPDAEAETDLVLDGGELTTRRVVLNGQELSANEYRADDEALTLFDVPDAFTLETEVSIHPEDNTALEGLYKSSDMYCTQCEAEGFRRITWFPDRPDVMSSFTTTIVADADKYPVLLSNGNPVDAGTAPDGRHYVKWEDPHRKPAYLFAMVAGDLAVRDDSFTTMSGREVTLRIFSEPRNIDKVDWAMTSLKASMAWDERVYGREYDLDIFMIVAVDSFNMGAMENKGLNIFNTSAVLASPETSTDASYQRVEAVVAHEYFHNWSGNRVTCRDWFQLSLKEGFTVFRDQAFSADQGSDVVQRIADVAFLRNAQFPEDAGPMAHPVRPDSYIEINNFYTTTIYEKGAEVVRMIHRLLGPERFRAGSDLYFERHDGQAVTTEDFVRAMEETSGVDLSQFRHWYSQAGTPEITAELQQDTATGVARLTIRQSCAPSPGQPGKLAYHMPFAVGLLDEAGADVAFETSDAAVVEQTEDTFTAVLNVTRPEQTFELRNVRTPVVPSLLRGFSAPVKLSYDYGRADLQFLASHDSDGFNRWEAGQRLAILVMQDLVRDPGAGIDEALMQALETTLAEAVERDADPGFDKAMVADLLAMPSEDYLGELADVVDVDGIHRARETVRQAIAERMQGLLVSLYKLNASAADYQPDGASMARRGLRNTALTYLTLPEDTGLVPAAVEQFETANNMTETAGALRALVNCPAEAAAGPKAQALLDFYNRWADDELVVDQWFAIQATCPLPDTLERVKALTGHERFTLAVPNRLRALVSAFAMQNTVNFHDASGEGYAFLADHVIALNSTNPLLAARIMRPLSRWERYDGNRQGLMREQLARILETDNLSKDVFEIASKSMR